MIQRSSAYTKTLSLHWNSEGRGLEQRSGSHYYLQVFTQRESCFRGAASTLNTSVMCNVYTSSFSFFDCVTPLEIS